MATLKNTTINDTGFIRLPPGTTAQRPASPLVGMIRYNTDLGFSEQYNSDGWQGIAPPPVIASISPTTFNGEQGTTITVNGSNFDTTATVSFVLTGGAVVNATTTTRVSSSQVTGTTPRDFLASESPATVRVTNGSGLNANAENALNFADIPIFTTSAGSLGTIFDNNRAGYSLSTAAATDAAGGTITYAIISGAVPAGLSFNTSTAAITGTATAVGSDTTSSFTIRATDNAGNTADRAFTITVRAPSITSFTSGSGTFSVPTGLTSVEVLVVGGGGGGGAGSGGHGSAGGGGAGGVVYVSSYPVTPGGSVPYGIGTGGNGRSGAPSIGANGFGVSGNNSNFGPVTAVGGGGGGGGNAVGLNGGSGGGAFPGNASVGTGTQPSQNPGVANLTNNGNPGGPGVGKPGGGAGGGATQAGQYTDPQRNGGAGFTTSISGSSVIYGGGGGGGGHGPTSLSPGNGGPGGGGAGGTPSGAGQPGTTNRGGGGGGGGENPSPATDGGPGGPGIVIIKF
jgi:hypothetical protein